MTSFKFYNGAQIWDYSSPSDTQSEVMIGSREFFTIIQITQEPPHEFQFRKSTPKRN